MPALTYPVQIFDWYSDTDLHNWQLSPPKAHSIEMDEIVIAQWLARESPKMLGSELTWTFFSATRGLLNKCSAGRLLWFTGWPLGYNLRVCACGNGFYLAEFWVSIHPCWIRTRSNIHPLEATYLLTPSSSYPTWTSISHVQRHGLTPSTQSTSIVSAVLYQQRE